MKENRNYTESNSMLPHLMEKNGATRSVAAEEWSSPLDFKQLFHDLQVQQLKLDIQEKELHYAQEELKKAGAILKAALDQSTSGIAIADAPDGKLRYVNEAGLLIRGCDRESIVNGVGIDQYVACWQIHEHDGSPLKTEDVPLARAILYGEQCSREIIVRRSDDDNRTVLANASPIKDETGKVIAGMVIFTDISDRKQAETYRDLSRIILQILNEPGNLQDSIQYALSVLKTRMEFDAVGIRLQEGDDFPYFSQIGFSKDFILAENSLIVRAYDGGVCRDLHGNICLECTCGLVVSGKTDASNPLFTPGGSFWTNDSFPILEIPPDADPRTHPRNRCIHQGYASVALVPIRNKDSIVGLIQFNDHRKGRFTFEAVEILEGIASHIGAALMRKKAEDELSRLESQLHQAQKMESVGRLAGGVAHDFNNMLCVILGHAYLALKDLDSTQPRYASLEEIRRTAERSADLVQQLLAFARKQVVEPKVLDLNKTVSGTLKMLQRLIGEGINLVWLPKPDLWPVKMDPSQIDQILANLCVNARDSIEDVGTITIAIENCVVNEIFCFANPDLVPGEYLLLTVSDDGCGMNADTLKQVFDPFFTTKSLGEGTGLGLSTVYGIVKQNNGFIKASSEPGLGTTFSIYLPRHVGKVSPVKMENINGPTPGGREAILLVEDEPAILNLISKLLTGLGYTVIPASSPVDAMSLAKGYSGDISLLLTDVIMPGMNGQDLANRLIPFCSQLKRLFMSGYTADVIGRHGVLDESLHFIHKPFSLPDLATKVREVLDSK